MIARKLLSSLAAGLIFAVAPLAQPVQAKSSVGISVRSVNPGFHQRSFGRSFDHRSFRHQDFRHHAFRHDDFRFHGFRYHGFRYQPRPFPFYGYPYYGYGYPYYWYPYGYYPDSGFYFYYQG
jgi:hypothetical protein